MILIKTWKIGLLSFDWRNRKEKYSNNLFRMWWLLEKMSWIFTFAYMDSTAHIKVVTIMACFNFINSTLFHLLNWYFTLQVEGFKPISQFVQLLLIFINRHGHQLGTLKLCLWLLYHLWQVMKEDMEVLRIAQQLGGNTRLKA